MRAVRAVGKEDHQVEGVGVLFEGVFSGGCSLPPSPLPSFLASNYPSNPSGSRNSTWLQDGAFSLALRFWRLKAPCHWLLGPSIRFRNLAITELRQQLRLGKVSHARWLFSPEPRGQGGDTFEFLL